jgi:hypothetical protein
MTTSSQHSARQKISTTSADSTRHMALAERVYERWPHVLLLISSGYARPHPDEIPDHGRFVPKPYRGETLVRHITEMMQGS